MEARGPSAFGQLGEGARRFLEAVGWHVLDLARLEKRAKREFAEQSRLPTRPGKNEKRERSR